MLAVPPVPVVSAFWARKILSLPMRSMARPWPAKRASPPTAATVTLPLRTPAPCCRARLMLALASAPTSTTLL